ncbi:GNAT family N-acetyltransferase [Shimia abyssi]|uniref:RimJ/RimL family protein N-acetyltransferase n=1 Tax=Shimia abyssi TaxID=1662395 RepID=A0A2P8FKN6_9RHOB|nr:GNAT family N-acetyltransferase [Shimia abyssi]PSL22287.1 RimJ/RimL family protein N-acetyltransferase [Shimia abyssi]
MTLASVISTQRLTLRRPDPSDLPVLTAFYMGPRSEFVGGPYTENQCFEKLAVLLGHWLIRGFGRYVIQLGDKPIGHVGPLCIDATKAPELTWTLWDGTQEGNGYATEAALAMRDHLLKDQNWPLLEILVQPANFASVRVAEKLGAALTEKPAPDWYSGCLTYDLTTACFAGASA